MTILDEDSLRLVFKEARSHGYFLNQRIKSETLYKVYNLAKLAPTAWNTCPMRVVFITSEEAKAKLMEALAPGNRDKTASAPVTAIIAIDMEFYTQLETISPRMANSSYFSELPESDFMQFVFRNANLQAGFFILAARACGLDCGPMSGFSNAKVDQLFFENSSWRSNFLINLGYGSNQNLPPRAARLEFDEACRII
ncbi:MAG: malonic semialdehyde reductase [Rhodobacteraceae bacterium]|nr:malonic semialdehyde reductase [Paracoccaceae bacterium]